MQAIAQDLAQLSPVAASDLPEPPKLTLWQRLLTRLASWRARRALPVIREATLRLSSGSNWCVSNELRMRYHSAEAYYKHC